MGFLIDTTILLASQEIERKCTLLTQNGKDFMDVPGLKFLAVERI